MVKPIGMRRHSSRTVPTQAVLFSETEMREQLLKDLPVTERRLDLTGVSTSLLEGGEGPPLVLLHGQGGFAAMWGRVIPHLVQSYHVVAPDLPGLGLSEVRPGNLDAPAMVAWLGELVAQTCAEPPVLVGHSLGGSFAAHFAIERGDRLRGIVLVDSGSLAPFRPAPVALAALVRYIRRPSAATYDRFSRQVFFDPDRVRYEGGRTLGGAQGVPHRPNNPTERARRQPSAAAAHRHAADLTRSAPEDRRARCAHLGQERPAHALPDRREGQLALRLAPLFDRRLRPRVERRTPRGLPRRAPCRHRRKHVRVEHLAL